MKTRLSALAAAIAALSTLTACGGGGGKADVANYNPAPQTPPTVTVTAPATATAGVAFSVGWSSTDATSCAADFTSSTGTSGSASVTASVTSTAAETQVFSVTCTGSGGSTTGNASVVVSPVATAEGAWQGTTEAGRALAGVVTHEGNYWLAYSSASDTAVPAGFYAGAGTSDGSGNFTATNALREFNFEGDGAMQGTLDSTTYTQSVGYTNANTLAGAFGAVAYDPNVYDATMTADNIFGSAGHLIFNFTGTYTKTGTGSTSGGSWTGTAELPLYHMTLHFTQSFIANWSNGGGKLNALTDCTDNSGGAGCSGFTAPLQGPYWNTVGTTDTDYQTKVPWTPAPGVYTWTLQFYQAGTDPDTGAPTSTYIPVPTTVTLTQSLPSITADSFTSTYNSIYETTPALATVEGSYTSGSTGIVSTMYPDASLTIAADGSVTGAEASSHCNYSGTLSAHATGNVYDVSLAFTDNGGSCAYSASGSFTGVATYDAGKLTLTATNSTRDKGFMVVATKGGAN